MRQNQYYQLGLLGTQLIQAHEAPETLDNSNNDAASSPTALRLSYSDYSSLAAELQLGIPNFDAFNQNLVSNLREVENSILKNASQTAILAFKIGQFISLGNYLFSAPRNETENREELNRLIEGFRDNSNALNINPELTESLLTESLINFLLQKDLTNWNLLTQQLIEQLSNPLSTLPLISQRQSDVDQTITLSENFWAVSLIRRPRTIHSEHALLVVEGVDQNTPIIWFIDFVGKPYLSGVEDGKVRIRQYREEFDDETGVRFVVQYGIENHPDKRIETNKALLFVCEDSVGHMLDIQEDEEIRYSIWNLPKDKAEQLLESVKLDRQNPPIFNITGAETIPSESTHKMRRGLGGSNKKVHNCYTWSRTKLLRLNDTHFNAIDLPDFTLKDWLYKATSRYLDQNRRYSFWGTRSSEKLESTYDLITAIIRSFSTESRAITQESSSDVINASMQ